MSKKRKLYEKALRGGQLTFEELMILAEYLGFYLERITGSHHIIGHSVIRKTLNMQPSSDGKAKKYQIKQLLTCAEENNLTVKDKEE